MAEPAKDISMDISTLHRRMLLTAGGGLLLGAAVTPAPVWAQRRNLDDDPFTQGVASGDPWPDGFVIWTRLAPRPTEEHAGMPMRTIAVRWEVAEDPAFNRIVRTGDAPAYAELGHSVHVELTGLEPARPYWYRFQAGDAQSSVGTVRTAPARDAAPSRLRIGLAGCQQYEVGFFSAYGHLAHEPDLDLIYHYGDYIYEGRGGRGGKLSGTDVRFLARPLVGDVLYSLDDYRRRYAQYKTDPELQAAHAAAAFVVTYDDGDVANDFSADWDPKGAPPEVFALRRAAAMQAWYENMPVRRAQFPRRGDPQVYRRLDFGRLMRMHVLDTRAYRSHGQCDKYPDAVCTTPADGAVSMLGAQQEAWLSQGLGHPARWNLIAQQVLVMPMETAPGGEGVPVGWNSYAPARDRLVAELAERNLSNVVIASGGGHQHFIGDVPLHAQAPDRHAVAAEFHGTSISSAGDGEPHRSSSAQTLALSPNLALINAQRGYQLFDITPEAWTTAVKVVDRVQTLGGALSTVAEFQVRPDRPGLLRA